MLCCTLLILIHSEYGGTTDRGCGSGLLHCWSRGSHYSEFLSVYMIVHIVFRVHLGKSPRGGKNTAEDIWGGGGGGGACI